MQRRDGSLKVQGKAAYTAEIPIAGMLYAAVVDSTISAGRIQRIETEKALAMPGVAAVYTHLNFPRLHPVRPMLDPGQDGKLNASGAGQWHLPLQDPQIFYSGQHIALVLAGTSEQAAEAAAQVHVAYEAHQPQVVLGRKAGAIFSPGKEWQSPADVSRGDFAAAFANADVRVDAEYRTAIQHHTTMEPHATAAVWEGAQLTVYEPSTWVYGVRKTLSAWLNMPESDIRVIQQFVGGSFGAKGPTWPHVALAAVAARELERGVRLILTRRQTFTTVGYRPQILHRIRLGATREGTLAAVSHHALAQTAEFDGRVVAPVTKTTRKLYACANCETNYRLQRGNLPGPFTFRGPGETPGLFALESAMDELAYALAIDPVELRLRNDAPDRDPETGKPWSSRSLRACLLEGGKRFGWEKRNPRPQSMRSGKKLLGMGMACMGYDAKMAPASARAVALADGKYIVQSATCDQGTGTYTVMAQVAAEALGVAVELVSIELGDTNMPEAPISAGSQTVASVGSAIAAACAALRKKLNDGPQLPAEATAKIEEAEGQHTHTCYSFGAHFAEVTVDPSTAEVRVTRYTGAFAAGRILNERTAHSQLIGGIIWGIGMALMEQTMPDLPRGRFVNTNLAEYHVPVNADIPALDAFFLPETDSEVNPLGAKGVGEIGTIGAAAPIANAVFHATGRRVRDLPITPEKLL